MVRRLGDSSMPWLGSNTPSSRRVAIFDGHDTDGKPRLVLAVLRSCLSFDADAESETMSGSCILVERSINKITTDVNNRIVRMYILVSSPPLVVAAPRRACRLFSCCSGCSRAMV